MRNSKATRVFMVLSMFIIFSCEKEEQPIEKQTKTGDQLTASVFIDTDYKYQVFYDLESK